MNLDTLTKFLNPFYKQLISKYSLSYISGSNWYVGQDLEVWWTNTNKIRYFRENKNKLKYISTIIINEENGNQEFVNRFTELFSSCSHN